MSDRREDEVLGTSLVNGTVSSLNGGVGRRANVLHSPSQVTGDRVSELRSVISKQVGNVGVSNGRVDKREEALGSVGQSLVDTVGSGGVSGGLEDDLGSDVIGNVLADTGKVNDGLDTDALQVGLGSDTAHHQHVRGTDGTSGQDDLLVGGDGSSGKISTGHRVLDAGSSGDATGRVGVDLEDTGVGQNVQVGPRWEGVDIGRLGVRTGPAKDGTEASFSDSVRAADWFDCLRDSPVGRVDTRSGDKGTPTVSSVRIGTDVDPNVLQDSGPLSDDRQQEPGVRIVQRSIGTVVLGVVGDVELLSDLLGRRGERLGLFHGGEHRVPVPSGSVGTGELSPGVDLEGRRSDAARRG